MTESWIDPDATRIKFQGPGPVAKIELANGVTFAVGRTSLPLSIGRGAGCDITIPSGHVSRRHCEVDFIDGELCLTDTSSNGTVVREKLVKQSSVPIAGRTSVYLAGEILITITPAATSKKADTSLEDRRRARERRQAERRQDILIVPFDLRKNQERRQQERRG
ncbi:MAG: FHA domain-containing protein [Pseudomonadota bacterium]